MPLGPRTRVARQPLAHIMDAVLEEGPGAQRVLRGVV